MDFGKIILLYLCIALSVSFFFPQIVLDSPNQSILGIFHIGYNESTKEVFISRSGFADANLDAQVFNDETKGGLWQSLGASVSSFFQAFTDGLRNVLGIMKILFKFLFSPFIFVMDPLLLGGAPSFVKLIFALPLVILGLIAIVKFIRGVGG